MQEMVFTCTVQKIAYMMGHKDNGGETGIEDDAG